MLGDAGNARRSGLIHNEPASLKGIAVIALPMEQRHTRGPQPENSFIHTHTLLGIASIVFGKPDPDIGLDHSFMKSRVYYIVWLPKAWIAKYEVSY